MALRIIVSSVARTGIVAIGLGLCVGCGTDATPTSPTVSGTSQTADCAASIAKDQTTRAVPSNETAFVVPVTAGGGCAWTAASSSDFIRILSASGDRTASASGTGSGSVQIVVLDNSGAARSGGLTIAGTAIAVTQAAAGGAPSCTFSAAPATSDPAPAGGGTIDVLISTACAWQASSSASFISVSGPTAGLGSGKATFAVAPNTGAARSGSVTVGGQVVTITQAAFSSSHPGACLFAVTPSTTSVSAAGPQSFSIAVAVTQGFACAWTAATTSGSTIVPMIAPASGTGDGTVTVTVSPNTDSAPRSIAVTVGGAVVTITQAAGSGGCGPDQFVVGGEVFDNLTADAQAITVVVSGPAACSWTATSAANFITIGAKSSGKVVLNVLANTGDKRTGTVTIAGHTFTVTQADGSHQP